MITQPSLLSRRLLVALLAGGIAVTSFDPSLAQPSRRPAASAQSDSASKEQASDAKRLPADVTTDQTVELAGRTLRFKATAGTIPINNGEGKLQAEIAFIAYLAPDTAAAPPHLRVQRRPRRRVRLSAARRARAVAPAARRRRFRRRRPRSCPIRRPGSTSPIWCSSIRSAPATAASSTPATRCASSSGRSTATSTCSRRSCANGSRRTAGRRRRNSSRARAMAASARPSSPQS